MARHKRLLFVLLALFASCDLVMADEPVATSGSNPPSAGTKPASQPSNWLEEAQALSKPREAPPTATPRLVDWVDYTGDLWHRAALTGDWGGLRQDLMDKGIRFDMNLTQALQGNWAGGVSKRSWYQGDMRYDIDVDTGAAGLWPGGLFHVRGETPYGRNNNLSSGALLPVNTDALYPVPGDNLTCLSEAYYVQFVAPWLGFMAGKVSPRESNVFSHDETTQFMNMAFNYNPIAGTTVPLDCLAAGAILRPTDWFMLTSMVLDSEGTANVSGFETAFERGTSFCQTAEVTIKPFDLQGHQRLTWAWSDKTRIAFQQDARVIIKDIILKKLGLGPGPTFNRSGSDWCIMYDFDQYLYTKPGTKDEGFGLFGRYGRSDGTVNPLQNFYSLGMGGKGMIPCRGNDTYGVGYYYSQVSDQFGPILSRFIRDEQGVELYYNIEVTPWLHITPDLQVIDPGRKMFSDTAVVAGIRMRIDF
jgi:porin